MKNITLTLTLTFSVLTLFFVGFSVVSAQDALQQGSSPSRANVSGKTLPGPSAFTSIGDSSQGDTGLVVCSKPPDCTYEEFIQTIEKVMNFIIITSASVAAIMFAYAGFLFMTAGGDTGKISKGKQVFTSVAIGFFIILSAWLIIKLVLTGLNADDYQDVLPN